MRFRVRVLRLAEQDFRSIVHWITQRSKLGAAAWVRAYQQVLNRLAQQADTYALAAENDEFDYEIREIGFKTRRGLPYRAVFTIVENEVRILRVRGPGQADLTRDDVSQDE